MPQTVWEKTKAASGTAYSKALKPGFDKTWKTLDKLGAPVNRLSNKLGAEAFWPTTLDKESDKAARILRSFCKDGFYSKIDEQQAQREAEHGEKVEGPKGKQRVLKKIPEKVIRGAKGLAIYTTMRSGLWISGAGGSGVLIARHPETGEWSPPSGILLHTAGLGFMVGVDIYDCVVVINSYKALESFTKVRCTLGSEVSAVVGPVGMGGVLDANVRQAEAPVWTYLKGRGFYAGVQVDGTIVIERTDENERFYREKIGVANILAGKARYPPVEQYRMLMETVKAAQGDSVDASFLPDAGTAPGDQEIEGGTSFGIPDQDDPDPYGVKALEAEGLSIREAGTHQRPSADVFEFKPAPTSPVYANFRRSIDTANRNRTNSWRGSMASLASVDRGTQTDVDEVKTVMGSPVREGRHSPAVKESEQIDQVDERDERDEQDEHGEHGEHDEQDDLSDDDHDDAIIETAIPVVARATVVSLPKRVPPALPPRNPDRVSSPVMEGVVDHDGFDRVSLDGDKKEPEEAFHSTPVTPAHQIPGSFH